MILVTREDNIRYQWIWKVILKTSNCIIGTEESNNESMRINEAPMICDKNKELK